MERELAKIVGDYQESVETRLEAIKCAKKGRKIEEERKKKGWRYIHITPTYQVFVPCDKKGNPTKEGMIRINRQKQLLGIKV